MNFYEGLLTERWVVYSLHPWFKDINYIDFFHRIKCFWFVNYGNSWFVRDDAYSYGFCSGVCSFGIGFGRKDESGSFRPNYYELNKL